MRKRRVRRRGPRAFAWALLGLLAAIALPSPAGAVTFTPTTTADGNNGACTPTLCTLRDAFIAANAADGNVVSIPPGHYVLSLGELAGGQSIALIGTDPRTTMVDAQGTSRVFRWTAPGVQDENVAISDLTVTGGTATATTPDLPGQGGGIVSSANLALRRVAIIGNHATFIGGGLNAPFKTVPSGPNTAIEESLIANNRVSGGVSDGSGGGAALFGDAAISNTTITGNSVSNPGTNQGGGLFSAKAVAATAPARLALLNTTIANNQVVGVAPAGAGNFGGGLSGAEGGGIPIFTQLSAQNTIIADNTVDGATQDCGLVQAQASLFNLSSDASCGFTDTSSKQNTNPQLGALADNGGPTNTLAIADSSPAKNTGANSGCPPADQRGVSRPQALICDIGAYERRAAELTVSMRASRSRVKGGGKKRIAAAKRRKGKKLSFIATVTNRGEQTAPGTQVSIKLPAKVRKAKLTGPCQGGQKTKKKKKKGKGKRRSLKAKGKRKRRGRGALVCVLGNVAPGESKEVQASLRPTKRKGRLKATATVTNAAEPTTATAEATVRIKKKKRRR